MFISDSPSPISASKNGFTTSRLALEVKHLAGCLPHTFRLGALLTALASVPAGILADIVYIKRVYKNDSNSNVYERDRGNEKPAETVRGASLY